MKGGKDKQKKSVIVCVCVEMVVFSFCGRCKRSEVCSLLAKNGLVLASGAEVAGEALAQALVVVADASAGAVSALLVALAKEHIASRRALLCGGEKRERKRGDEEKKNKEKNKNKRKEQSGPR